MSAARLTLVTMLVAGCGPDFSPDLSSLEAMEGGSEGDSESDGASSGTTGGASGSGESSDGASTGTPETASTGDGSTGDESTGDEDALPGPDEPCEPFSAFDGTAPCYDPKLPDAEYTCAPVQLMPEPDTYVWEFRCIKARDLQGDGYDLGDPCDDDGGAWTSSGTPAGCLNSYCLSNGLETNPMTDEHVHWPAGECLFGSFETTLTTGCCSPYCDADHPCDAGWSCISLEGLATGITLDVGACVWAG